LPDLANFARSLEEAVISAIEDGIMTGDLAKLADPHPDKFYNSWEFIDAIVERLKH